MHAKALPVQLQYRNTSTSSMSYWEAVAPADAMCGERVPPNAIQVLPTYTRTLKIAAGLHRYTYRLLCRGMQACSLLDTTTLTC